MRRSFLNVCLMADLCRLRPQLPRVAVVATYALAVFVGAAGVSWRSGSATAQRIENRVAVFAALDKVTARIKKLEVPLNETVEFGALRITPRVCYSRPATERPKTTTFVEVTETELDGSEKPLFMGWMFAESPGLHAVEHPVFDVWLTECTGAIGGQPVAAAATTDGSDETDTDAAAPAPAPAQPARPRRRFRR